MAGVTPDAGGLIALGRNDRRVLMLLARARETIRQPERQVGLARLVRQPTTDVAPLDRVDTSSVGRLLAASATADIVDAHIVICARRTGQPVVTSGPGDLRILDPRISLVIV